MSDKKMAIYRSINETCSFYFEPLGWSGRPGHALMAPARMNEIFNICLKDKNLSTQNINKINKWKDEKGYV
jgi:hypothetical protein